MKQLDGGDEEGQRLAGSGPGRPEQVLALQQRGDGLGLDLRHVRHLHVPQPLLGALRQWQARKCLVAHDRAHCKHQDSPVSIYIAYMMLSNRVMLSHIP